MKRIAIPISEGRLSRHFGSCSYFRIYAVEDAGIQSSCLDAPGKADAENLAAWAARQGISDVITYQIGMEIIGLFARHKINVWVGAPDLSPDELISAYLDGTLISDLNVMDKSK
jgi:ATP-binding protein involved in chromosome partitioning